MLHNQIGETLSWNGDLMEAKYYDVLERIKNWILLFCKGDIPLHKKDKYKQYESQTTLLVTMRM